MNDERTNSGLLPYDVILAAVSGDALSMERALQHFERYIMYYSLKKIYDEYGNAHVNLDEDKVNRMRSKLIRAILGFKI